MQNEKRRCKFYQDGSMIEGTFIQFGPVEYFDDSNQIHTPLKAIVEKDNGEVVVLKPNSITFIKS